MIKALLITIAGLIGRGIAILALFFYAKKSGKDEQKHEAIREAAEDAQARLDIQDAVNKLDPNERRRLLNKWTSHLQRVDTDTPDKQ